MHQRESISQMNDLKYSVPSSSTGRRILKIAAVSIGLAVCALVVGAPLGYFEAELSASVDPMRLLLLNEASFALAYFLCCFAFARKWPDGAAFRTLLAFAVLQLLSVALVAATGAGFPPRAVLVLSIVSGAACSLLGAVVGSWGVAGSGSTLEQRPLCACSRILRD